MLQEGESDRGCVNPVVRIGDTVRRPVHRWTPAVHALLRYLEAVGFSGVPRVLGFDELGREVLSFTRIQDMGFRIWGQGAIAVVSFHARPRREYRSVCLRIYPQL